jgi:hypothetical protein
MSTLYITEYGGMAPGPLQVAMTPKIATYTLTVGSAAVSTRPFDPATNYIRLHTDAICSIAIVASTTGVATTSDPRMAADNTEYFGVPNGYRVAVISNT